MKVYISETAEQTQKIAFSLTKELLEKFWYVYFLLEGNLGAGKTEFVKGVAKGLGMSSRKIHSPTFVFITEHYKKDKFLYHIDFYRLEKNFLPKILLDHIEENQFIRRKKVVSCIEWANKVPQKIIKKIVYESKKLFNNNLEVFVKVKIEILRDCKRKIYISRVGV